MWYLQNIWTKGQLLCCQSAFVILGRKQHYVSNKEKDSFGILSMEREERTELLQKGHHRLQLEDPAPAGPARNKSHKEREFGQGEIQQVSTYMSKMLSRRFFPF